MQSRVQGDLPRLGGSHDQWSHGHATNVQGRSATEAETSETAFATPVAEAARPGEVRVRRGLRERYLLRLWLGNGPVLRRLCPRSAVRRLPPKLRWNVLLTAPRCSRVP